MEIRLCPHCGRADVAPATRCCDCDVPLQVHDERHLLGSVLGNYRLERVLGSGGMGVVFAARHQSLLREAAIKVLQPELDARGGGGEFAQRFLREARLLATLEHPNIVGIYDFDVSPLGFPYLVMPRLRGETLRAFLSRHPYGIRQDWIAAIAGDIAAGLAHAHRHGVVHRDLKPENVFLALDADGVRAKLLDFGIAHSATEDELTRTATGTVMGTPLYQAPEQLRGEGVTAATDQYSFALLFAELLRGTPVRQGRSLTDILLRDSTAPLPADMLPEGIDAATSAALARATAPAPERRFSDMSALLAALALPAAERELLLSSIDDGSSAAPLTVVVSPPQGRTGDRLSAPTTPPPQRPATPLPTPGATGAAVAPMPTPTASRRPLAIVALLLVVTALAALGWWRASTPVTATTAASTAWLREAEVLPLPPGLQAPLADIRGGLLLQSAGGWTLFDPATRTAGASAALGVAEQLLGVDDRGQLWLAHDGTIESLKLDNNRRSTLVSGATLLHGDAQTRWKLAASGRWLARLDADGRFRVFRVAGGNVEKWIDSPGQPGDSTRFALGDRYAVLVRPHATIEVFALDARRSAWQAGFAPFRIRDIALAEDLDRLAVAGDAGHLAVWQLSDGRDIAAPQPAREVRALLWITDGARLVTADTESLTLWQWQHGQPAAQLQLPGGAGWLYRGSNAIYAARERELVRYEFGPPPARRVAADIGDTWALVADAGGAYAGGSKNGDLVRVRDGPEPVERRNVHNDGITDLQFFNDRLVSSSDDRTIAVWRLPGLELEWRAKGHAFLVNQIAIGTSLWSSSSDGSLRRWRWPELEPAETIDLRARIDPGLELHGLRVFGDDAEILAGTWNRLLVELKRDGDDWRVRTAPFESDTGYRLIPLRQLDAVLVVGINPGRLAVIDRKHDRIEQLPRDLHEWHAAVADPDGHSVWLGGDSVVARLSVERRDDGHFRITRTVQESSSYGEIGSIAMMPATNASDAPTLVVGNERGEILFVRGTPVGASASAVVETQATTGFSATKAR